MPSLAKQILLARTQRTLARYPHFLVLQGQVARTATWRQLRDDAQGTAAWLGVHAAARRALPPALRPLCRGPTLFWGARTPEALRALLPRAATMPGWVLLGAQLEGRCLSPRALARAVQAPPPSWRRLLRPSPLGRAGEVGTSLRRGIRAPGARLVDRLQGYGRGAPRGRATGFEPVFPESQSGTLTD